jgi:hypothetical protein
MAVNDDRDAMTDYDTPWKGILEHYFQDFVAFFYPQAHADIDWGRGHEFLDKELAKVVRDAEAGQRRVDKLVRVWRKGGTEVWVLIHVEIQAQRETDFPRRMYVYNYRLFDRYNRPVASFAILADTEPGWRPSDFHYELWGSQVRLSFPSVKLLDYRQRRDELEVNSNPFAVVVLAHLAAQATQRDSEARYRGKWALTLSLYRRGLDRRAVLELYRFIDWLLELPKPQEQRFEAELTQYEEQEKMPYITHIERNSFERGVQQGLQQGVQQGEVMVLKRQLTHRFGALPGWAIERLEKATPVELETWAERLLEESRLEDVFSDGKEG